VHVRVLAPVAVWFPRTRALGQTEAVLGLPEPGVNYRDRVLKGTQRLLDARLVGSRQGEHHEGVAIAILRPVGDIGAVQEPRVPTVFVVPVGLLEELDPVGGGVQTPVRAIEQCADAEIEHVAAGPDEVFAIPVVDPAVAVAELVDVATPVVVDALRIVKGENLEGVLFEPLRVSVHWFLGGHR
jgi:hypothetical protein